MQVNAFGFPLGTSTAGNAAAGAPALGFLQALGVAGAGQPVLPTGGPAMLPVTSLAHTGPAMTLTTGAAPGLNISAAAFLPTALLPTADVATLPIAEPVTMPNVGATSLVTVSTAAPLLPQGNDALASLTTLSAAPMASPTRVAVTDVTAKPAVLDKPILATLQTTTSLSGLLATATRPVVDAPAPSTAEGVTTQPVGKPAIPVSPGVPPAQTPLIEAEPALAAETPAVTEFPKSDVAPVKGKPAKASAEDGEAPVAPAAPDAAPQPLAAAMPVAQPLPQQAAAQPAPAQTQAQAQTVQVASRQPRAASPQANVAEAPARATRKPGTEAAQPGDTAQAKGPDSIGSDFTRAVQASSGSDQGAAPQDGSQSRDPQVKLDAVASVSQPSHTAPTTGSTAAAPAAPLPQEPVVATRPGRFGHAMGVEIARKVEAGEETLRVRLSPDNLGRVEVTLAFEDGNLKATVRAESQRALDLLRQDMPDLARTLDQAGVRTDAQSFRFEARADTGSGQQQQGNGQQQRGGNPHQQHAQADDLEPAPAYRAVRADGQVDLLA